MFIIPVSLGRNISFLIEIAVKYYIARRNGSISFLDNYYSESKKNTERQNNEEQKDD
jgi:serine kinase of HPr protein (carbohydrate metabolism regulator)